LTNLQDALLLIDGNLQTASERSISSIKSRWSANISPYTEFNAQIDHLIALHQKSVIDPSAVANALKTGLLLVPTKGIFATADIGIYSLELNNRQLKKDN
jgi:hypothetical protein